MRRCPIARQPTSHECAIPLGSPAATLVRPKTKRRRDDELYECRLTTKGRGLFPIYAALMEWATRWTGLSAPPAVLLHKPCGERVTARVVCSNCAEDLDAHDTEPLVAPGLIDHRAGR